MNRCGCGQQLRTNTGGIGQLCDAGHVTWPFLPPPKWKPGRCPDSAHRTALMAPLAADGAPWDGDPARAPLWWCGEPGGSHYVRIDRPEGIRHVSPSSINMARQCMRRYWFQYVLRHKEPPGPEAVRGTLSHRILELLAAQPDGQRDLDRARKLANSEWPAFKDHPDFQRLRLTRDQAREFTGEAIASVGRALDIYPLNGRDIIGPEVRFELHLNGVKVHGVMDLVERPSDPILRDHGFQVMVTDYKTGKVPCSVGRQSKYDRKLDGSPAPPEDSEAEKLVQAHIYNAAARQLYEVPNQRQVGAQLLYIGPDTGVLHAPPSETRQVMDGVKTTWKQIKAAEEDGYWPASTGPLCGWCPHLVWDNGDGTFDFCGEGLAYAFRRIESRWGWTKYDTNEPVPAAVTIRGLDPEVERQARDAAAASVIAAPAPLRMLDGDEPF